MYIVQSVQECCEITDCNTKLSGTKSCSNQQPDLMCEWNTWQKDLISYSLIPLFINISSWSLLHWALKSVFSRLQTLTLLFFFALVVFDKLRYQNIGSVHSGFTGMWTDKIFEGFDSVNVRFSVSYA